MPWGWDGGQREVLEGEEGEGKASHVGDDQGELGHGRLVQGRGALGAPRGQVELLKVRGWGNLGLGGEQVILGERLTRP